MIPEISRILHEKVTERIKDYPHETVLDIGGKGRAQHFVDGKVTNANMPRYNGCKLDFSTRTFDCTMSVATVEHVDKPKAFLREAIRVSRYASVHWFPCGTFAQELEELLKKAGHDHTCTVPDWEFWDIKTLMKYLYRADPWPTCGEHLKRLVELYPKLRRVRYDEDVPYGVVLEFRK